MMISGTIAILCAITLLEVFQFVKAQDPTLQNIIMIPNCSESYLDNQGVERCQVCQAGFAKTYDMTSCKLSSTRGCIWESKWGCLECQCGWAVQNDLKACIEQKIEGCLRLDQAGTGCIQPKIGYTIIYTESAGNFVYSSIKPDQGEFCGWQKSGDAGCTKCQIGFYLEAGGKSCKKLSKRLQNEHSFWLASNDLTDPLTAIQIIPGWEDKMKGKTNAGAFEKSITGCVKYDDVLNRYDNVALCTQCDKDLVKIQNQLECVAGHHLCDYADNDKKYCIKCKDPLNYWADSVSNLCLIRDQMFDFCDVRSKTSDECVKCVKEGYKLDATKKCVYIDNCKTSDQLKDCTECNEQYQIDDDGSGNKICNPLPPNCKISTGANCTTCVDGYYDFNGKCYLMAPNCATVDKTDPSQANHFCSACKTDYHLVDKFCYKNIYKCTTHFTTGKDGCEVCETMYTPSIDASECLLHNLQFQKYCQETDGKGACKQCISLKFIPQCLDITNADLCLASDGKADKCLQCLPNSFLNNNVCQASDSTCIRTDGQTKCQQCKMGYYIDPTTFRCLPISSCSVSNGVSSDCLACIDGYILNNNKCDVKTPGCAIEIYDGSTKKCIQCQSGYANNSGVCTIIPNCLISDGISNKCYQCVADKQFDKGFTDPNLQCIVFNPNPIYKPPLFCNVFYYGFTTLKDNVCTALPLVPDYGYCLQCQSPRVLRLKIDGTDCLTSTSVTQECVELSQIGTLIDNCRVYDFTPGKCRICENNYLPDANGICVFQSSIEYCQNTIDPLTFQNVSNCKVCMGGVYLINNTCKTTVQNCSTYTAAGCTGCQNNFYFNSAAQLCTPYAGQQCDTYSDTAKTSCATCKAGFTYVLPSSPNTCLYNPYSTSCTDIVVKDPVNNSYCYPIADLAKYPDPLCQEYNSSGVCSKCTTGNLLRKPVNNKIYLQCVAKTANCQAIFNGQYCQTCAPTYFLNLTYEGDDCVKIDNCISPTGQGDGTGCKQCDLNNGYYLDSTGFSCSKLANCVTSTDGVNPFCQKCLTLFYPSVGGQCVNLSMPGCIASSGLTQTCDQCEDYFYKDANGICQPGEVANCKSYSPLGNPTSAKVCAVCESGFKLTATFTCEVLPNCLISDGTATAVCTGCKDYFYFKSATNTCVPPETPVDYCRTYQADSNVCTECDRPFYLDGQTCKSRSTRNDYCKAYSLTSKPCLLCQTKSIGGIIVQDEHSLKKGFCNPIKIDKCDVYQQNQPKCSLCNQISDLEQGWLVPSKNYCSNVENMKCLTVYFFKSIFYLFYQ